MTVRRSHSYAAAEKDPPALQWEMERHSGVRRWTRTSLLAFGFAIGPVALLVLSKFCLSSA